MDDCPKGDAPLTEIRRPYSPSSDQLRFPHKHSNIRIVLPVFESSRLQTRYRLTPSWRYRRQCEQRQQQRWGHDDEAEFQKLQGRDVLALAAQRN